MTDAESRELARYWLGAVHKLPYATKSKVIRGLTDPPVVLWVPDLHWVRVLVVGKYKDPLRFTTMVGDTTGTRNRPLLLCLVPKADIRQTRKGLVLQGEEIEEGARLVENFPTWVSLGADLEGATVPGVAVEEADDFLEGLL